MFHVIGSFHANFSVLYWPILQLLAKESLLDDIVKQITEEKDECNNEQSCATKIKVYVEKHRDDLGLPSSQLQEMVALLDEIFSEVDSKSDAAESDRDTLKVLLKKILEKIADKLEANPILYDLQFPLLEEAWLYCKETLFMFLFLCSSPLYIQHDTIFFTPCDI